MSENMWMAVQILMWGFGIQTTILIAILGVFHASINRRFEQLDEKLSKRIDQVNTNLENKIIEIDTKLEKRMDHSEAKMDKVGDKVEKINERLFWLEGNLATHGHCLFHQNKSEQKAE